MSKREGFFSQAVIDMSFSTKVMLFHVKLIS